MIQDIIVHILIIGAIYVIVDTLLFIIKPKKKLNEKIRTKTGNKGRTSRVLEVFRKN